MRIQRPHHVQTNLSIENIDFDFDAIDNDDFKMPRHEAAVQSAVSQDVTVVDDPTAVDDILRCIFRHSPDTHVNLRLRMALGSGAAAYVTIDNTVVEQLHMQCPPCLGKEPCKTVHYGKTIATNCRLQQMSRLSGAPA